MSTQPPHQRPSDVCTHELGFVTRRYLSAVAALVCITVAGCAAHPEASYQFAGPEEIESPFMLVGNRDTRAQYLANIRSDPLGAYLSSKERYSRPQSTGLATTALSYLGTKYRYGGNSPDEGFDCSGLVRYAAEKSLGLKLPRRSADMARLGESIKRNELERGDLVFFNTRGRRFSHVGIYLGNGKFVHAPSTGSKVRVESLDIAYWKKRYNGARRLASKPDTERLIGKSTREPKTLASN